MRHIWVTCMNLDTQWTLRWKSYGFWSQIKHLHLNEHFLIINTSLTPIPKMTWIMFSNYWTRLSKILWFVIGEQINYLPKPKAETNSASANDWSARHWQITIFCDNRVQWLFYHSITEFVFLRNIFGKRSNLHHFHASAIASRRKAWFHLRISRIVFAAKNSWATLRMSTPLFVGSY